MHGFLDETSAKQLEHLQKTTASHEFSNETHSLFEESLENLATSQLPNHQVPLAPLEKKTAILSRHKKCLEPRYNHSPGSRIPWWLSLSVFQCLRWWSSLVQQLETSVPNGRTGNKTRKIGTNSSPQKKVSFFFEFERKWIIWNNQPILLGDMLVFNSFSGWIVPARWFQVIKLYPLVGGPFTFEKITWPFPKSSQKIARVSMNGYIHVTW